MQSEPMYLTHVLDQCSQEEAVYLNATFQASDERFFPVDLAEMVGSSPVVLQHVETYIFRQTPRVVWPQRLESLPIITEKIDASMMALLAQKRAAMVEEVIG